LLSQRAEEANLLYLTESKRRRKNATKQASTQLPPKTTTTSSSSNDKPTAKRTPKNNNNNNKRKKAMSSSDDESASSENDSRKVEEIDEDDEDEDDEEETISSDNGSVHDISDYLYLINMLHYDKDEKCVYISTRVVEEGDYIVVYRKRQLKNGQWAKSESYQPIFAKDVVEMTKLYSMNNKKS